MAASVSIFIILFAIAIAIVAIYWPSKHEFWDKQSVIHSSFDYRQGILCNNLQNSQSSRQSECQKITAELALPFLNQHYLKERISEKYLNHIIDPKCDRWFGHFSKSSNELNGTIFAKCINIRIQGETRPAYYVDFLCASERKSGIATKLIAAVIGEMIANGIPVAIFKIDQRPLPFQFIFSDRYYIAKLADFPATKTTLRELDDQSAESVYRFVRDRLNRADLCEDLTLAEFKKSYLPIPELIYSYYKIKDGKVMGFATLVRANYGTLTAMDLIYNFGILIEEICAKIRDQAEYIYKIGYSPGFAKGRKTYLHLFNHGIAGIKRICFNRH